MDKNPFQPPQAEVLGDRHRRPRPVAVVAVAVLCTTLMLAAVLLAVLRRPMSEAIIVVFFSAFLWFVPVGILRGRPWAPAVAAAMGIFVATFAFGSLLLAGGEHDSLERAFRCLTGLFSLVLAGVMLALRRHRFFAAVALHDGREA